MKPTRSRRNVIADLKARTKPKRKLLRVVTAQIDATGVGLVPLSQADLDNCAAKFMVVPPIMGLDEWEAVAAPYQDKLVADARSDIEVQVATQRPEGEVPQHWKTPQVYRSG